MTLFILIFDDLVLRKRLILEHELVFDFEEYKVYYIKI